MTPTSFREQLIAATMKATGCSRTEAIVILDRVHDRLGGVTHAEAVAANPMPEGPAFREAPAPRYIDPSGGMGRGE